LQILKNENIDIKEKLFCVEDLKNIDAAFICGTSPGVLPVAKIDNYTFDVNNIILRKIIFEFNNVVSENIN
jgi:branched-chain amino acid aminotransferase